LVFAADFGDGIDLPASLQSVGLSALVMWHPLRCNRAVKELKL
jgi:hypothetical protein